MEPPSNERLRATAARLAGEWNLSLQAELHSGTCSLVLAGMDEAGAEVVLKVPNEDVEERHAAIHIRAFASSGGVSVLRSDPETGSVLMPRLRPGRNLVEDRIPEDNAILICADLIQRLRQAEQVDAPPLETWFSELDDAGDDALVRHAAIVARRLIESTEAKCLLHADLHHFNILSSGDRWIAIDPKGMFGDPTFEAAAFIRNPIGVDLQPSILAQRIVRFSSILGDPVDRIWGWAFAQTTLSSVWSPGDYDWRSTAQSIFDARALI